MSWKGCTLSYSPTALGGKRNPACTFVRHLLTVTLTGEDAELCEGLRDANVIGKEHAARTESEADRALLDRLTHGQIRCLQRLLRGLLRRGSVVVVLSGLMKRPSDWETLPQDAELGQCIPEPNEWFPVESSEGYKRLRTGDLDTSWEAPA